MRRGRRAAGAGASAGAGADAGAGGLGEGSKRCLDLAGASANRSGAEPPLPQVLLVGAHAPQHFFPKFVPYVFEVWKRVSNPNPDPDPDPDLNPDPDP